MDLATFLWIMIPVVLVYWFAYSQGKAEGRQEGYNRARSIFGAGK